MTEDDKITIRITTDAEMVSVCALMMSQSNPWITLGMDYQQCMPSFEGLCKEIYVAEYQNKIIGFVILQICGSFRGYIQTICVNHHHRGKGIGKKMLAFCEKRILQFSPNVFICVSSFNSGALKLYREFGFELVGELPNFVKDGFTELLLRKTVGPLVGYKPDNAGCLSQ